MPPSSSISGIGAESVVIFARELRSPSLLLQESETRRSYPKLRSTGPLIGVQVRTHIHHNNIGPRKILTSPKRAGGWVKRCSSVHKNDVNYIFTVTPVRGHSTNMRSYIFKPVDDAQSFGDFDRFAV